VTPSVVVSVQHAAVSEFVLDRVLVAKSADVGRAMKRRR
jgi:hypothetical protein